MNAASVHTLEVDAVSVPFRTDAGAQLDALQPGSENASYVPSAI